MDFSMDVSQLCRQVDAFLAEKAGVSAPLLQVGLFARAQEWTEKLVALQQRIRAQTETAQAQLKAIDAAWTTSAKPGSPERQELLTQLEALWRLLSYFARWTSQLQERVVQLSF